MSALQDLKVIEFGGIGPAPFCGMLLGDMGAEVLRIDRLEPSGLGVDVPARFDLMARNKRAIALDLKAPAAKALALALIGQADVLIEGFRPGTMERLGLGPDDCAARNPRLVYARITGWGQDGPLAKAAGHDLNYIALTGALHAIGPREGVPVPPLSLLGDFGGGGLNAAFGILCALHERQRSGKGQVVDAAMIDGVASLMTSFYGFRQMGYWTGVRGDNIVDGGAHFYGCYETLDGRTVAVGAVEPKFFNQLLALVGLDPAALPAQDDRAAWQDARKTLEAVFKTRTRDHWASLLEGSDACFSPVLEMTEAAGHPHNRARQTFVSGGDVWQPAPSPRLGRTPGSLRRAPEAAYDGVREALADWGLSSEAVDLAETAGVLRTQGSL